MQCTKSASVAPHVSATATLPADGLLVQFCEFITCYVT